MTTYYNAEAVDIAWDDSQLDEEGANVLYCSLTVNGYSMHLEAFEVHYVGGDDNSSLSCIEAVHSQWDDELEFLCIKCDGPPTTFEYKGRLFVALATPHGE